MVQFANVFVPCNPFQPSVMYHCSLFNLFVLYEEIEVLQLQPLELYFQHFIFFVTYKWAK
jgi:hypothetical protein